MTAVNGTPWSMGAQSGGFGRGRPGTAILLPRRRPGYLGPVHIMQVVLAEVVVVAVLASFTRGLVTAVGAVLAAAVLLLLTFTRYRGRWWLERQLMTRRYQKRRRIAAGAPQSDDVRLAALRRLAPGLVVENVQVAGGDQVGVARDDAGWFAVAAIPSSSPMRDGSGGLPLDALAYALAEAGQPGAVLQVVIQAVPSPSTEAAANSPAGHSYRQLLAQFGQASVPAHRSTWIAVRLDARSLAEALADHTVNVDTAPVVVAALVRRVAKALRPAGINARLLDADGLLASLMLSCDLDLAAWQPRPTQAREDWSTWRSSRFVHRSYWIRDWPPVAKAGALLDWMFTVPTALTSVSLILAPEPGERLVDLKGLVRVSAGPNDLEQACLALVRGARKSRADLFPLDGEQSPAVYASAPSGGGAR
jgi:type VII secretion protein EccE